METTLRTKLIDKSVGKDSPSDSDFDFVFDPPIAHPRKPPIGQSDNLKVSGDLEEIDSMAANFNSVIRGDPMDIDSLSVSPSPSSSSLLSLSRKADKLDTPKRSLRLQHSSLQEIHPSPLSVPSEPSDHSSNPSVISSKATTPVDVDSSRDGGAKKAEPYRPRVSRRTYSNSRPKVSIPPGMAPHEYATDCILAVDWTMLNAYALHQEEYALLRHHISYAQVSTYLNIRNGILRLWANNPLVPVTREEAIGCAKDPRWFDVASLSYDWLVRKGQINFGCVKHRKSKHLTTNKSQGRKQKTIVVIGAGLAGLGCARQLDGLIRHYSQRLLEIGEEAPRVVVLEGRSRVGGRVYSRAVNTEQSPLPDFGSERLTVEMGGMILTGFERGNPLNTIVRGQLKLPYHELKPDLDLYDMNGKVVDKKRDNLLEGLYNDCLDRISQYKFKLPPPKLIEGNRDLMDEGRDSTAEGQKTIAYVEETTASLPHAPPVSEQNVAPQVELVPISTDCITGKPNVEPGVPATQKSAAKAKAMGWNLKQGVSEDHDLDLETPSQVPGATLGSVMDDCITQYKQILELNPLDFRLLNWHIANLEYSNANNYRNLSLQGWDIDTGNEWEGKHTMIVGGYQNVPRGLMSSPSPLDVKTKSPVTRISYTPGSSEGSAQVECEDGTNFDADYIVNTIPLGVLKQGSVKFEPELPSWKTEAIQRLGFGVLNKVILIYDAMFWDPNKDFFGVVRNPPHARSVNQKDYTAQRGRFFQWLNVSSTSGVPVLLAFMAGDAASDVEHTSNDDLVREATEVLKSRFGQRVPYPRQAFVSRWASDRFARGSYSSAGPDMKVDDYDKMAKPVGNLFFAGEHTTGTHPATVHGAYLSGLRAASEVLDALIGPIVVPTPLIRPRETPQSLKRKAEQHLRDPKRARLEAWEMEYWDFLRSKIGEYPYKPAKVAGHAYLLYSKAHYEAARQKCLEGRRAGKGKPAPNEVRVMTSKMWKDASPEEKKPFEEQAVKQKEEHAERLRNWNEKVKDWESKAQELRKEFEKINPIEKVNDNDDDGQPSGGRRRRGRFVESYAEGSDDEDVAIY
ncbi:putative lysine-specific histone demethylase 1 [Zalerion maritima]|uniref:Lysine-specific histone demethylase 1 n=1 Tax=Zalerion maritima TaxID=339359 RepID=A0AAD5WYJ0_9PEZI|nr:putative lysine-specific histone demethylase 1 [Zalerion maritima]